jgi:hypothetical protein
METMRSGRRVAQPRFVDGSSWEQRRWVAVDGGEARTGNRGVQHVGRFGDGYWAAMGRSA